jgi:hypothetical protein
MQIMASYGSISFFYLTKARHEHRIERLNGIMFAAANG